MEAKKIYIRLEKKKHIRPQRKKIRCTVILLDYTDNI